MSEPTMDRDELLIAELYRLGITHLWYSPGQSSESLSPSELIAGLAESSSARLNSSLILLFLRHPELSDAVPDALAKVSQTAADTLKLYYQAATYLQREMQPQLHGLLGDQNDLQDLFSQELNTPPVETLPVGASCQAALDSLGEIHKQRSGWNCSWGRSYRQHIALFFRLLNRERREHAHTHS